LKKDESRVIRGKLKNLFLVLFQERPGRFGQCLVGESGVGTENDQMKAQYT